MDFTKIGYQSDDETTEALLSDDGGTEVSCTVDAGVDALWVGLNSCFFTRVRGAGVSY